MDRRRGVSEARKSLITVLVPPTPPRLGTRWDALLELPQPTEAAVEAAKGHILDSAELVGTYQKHST